MLGAVKVKNEIKTFSEICFPPDGSCTRLQADKSVLRCARTTCETIDRTIRSQLPVFLFRLRSSSIFHTGWFGRRTALRTTDACTEPNRFLRPVSPALNAMPSTPRSRIQKTLLRAWIGVQGRVVEKSVVWFGSARRLVILKLRGEPNRRWLTDFCLSFLPLLLLFSLLFPNNI